MKTTFIDSVDTTDLTEIGRHENILEWYVDSNNVVYSFHAVSRKWSVHGELKNFKPHCHKGDFNLGTIEKRLRRATKC